MNIQYLWIAIVVVGIVGGIEIGYAVSTNIHNPYGMHNQFFKQRDGWHHNSGYMMQDPNFRHQMYSSMFNSTQYREEMSQYLAEHPSMMQSWSNTMMNNPQAMQTMMNNPQHLQLMQKMMGNFSTSGKGGMGMMNYNSTKGTYGMGNMSNMMHP